jgi:hypothetical protein
MLFVLAAAYRQTEFFLAARSVVSVLTCARSGTPSVAKKQNVVVAREKKLFVDSSLGVPVA